MTNIKLVFSKFNNICESTVFVYQQRPCNIRESYLANQALEKLVITSVFQVLLLVQSVKCFCFFLCAKKLSKTFFFLLTFLTLGFHFSSNVLGVSGQNPSSFAQQWWRTAAEEMHKVSGLLSELNWISCVCSQTLVLSQAAATKKNVAFKQIHI